MVAAPQHGRLAAGHPEFARLLRDSARQSVRATNVLCGMTQRIATSNLFSLTRDVMASLEDEKVKPTGPTAYKSDLRNIASTRARRARAQAQIVYLKGLMRGLVALVVLAPLLALALSAARGARRRPGAVRRAAWSPARSARR